MCPTCAKVILHVQMAKVAQCSELFWQRDADFHQILPLLTDIWPPALLAPDIVDKLCCVVCCSYFCFPSPDIFCSHY